MAQYILIHGTQEHGYAHIGPFSSREAAEQYGSLQQYEYPWSVIELLVPRKPWEILNVSESTWRRDMRRAALNDKLYNKQLTINSEFDE